MKTNSYKTNWKIKQIVSGVLATIVFVTGGTLIAKNVNKNKVKDNGTTTSISDQSLPEKTNPEYNDLLLTADFDINDEKAVRERAEEIKALQDSLQSDTFHKDLKLSLEQIINIIYFVNGKYEKININNLDNLYLKSTKLDGVTSKNLKIYYYCQELQSQLYVILYGVYSNYNNISKNLTEGKDLYVTDMDAANNDLNNIVYSYMFIAQSGDYKNSNLEMASYGKNYIQALLKKDLDEAAKMAQSGYEYNNSIFNEKDEEYINSVKSNQAIALQNLYSALLSKEQNENKYYQDTLEVAKPIALGVYKAVYPSENAQKILSEVLNLALHDGVVTRPGLEKEKTVASSNDKAVAKKVAGNTKDAGKKVEVEAGGKKVSSGTTKVQGGKEIKTETRTFVADVPTTSYTKTSKGGKVVEEREVYNNDDAKITQEDKGQTETTTVVVDEGGSHVYIDADEGYSLTKK